MAWNEPGNGKEKDPWGNRGNQDGPPDLDELVRKMQDKFGGLFGRKGGGPRGTASSGGGAGGIGLVLIIIVVAVIWLLSGFYIVDEKYRGLVLRFGEFQETTMPGLQWHIPWPVETVEKVLVTEVQTYQNDYQMLTGDLNLINIKLNVQYRVADPKHFLFQVKQPVNTLQEVTESALREAVGDRKFDAIVEDAEGRDLLVKDIKKQIQQLMMDYKTGIEIDSVNLQDIQPPREVAAAFDDVATAQEDQERYIEEGRAFEKNVIPRAQGEAESIREKAKAYKERTIAHAEGETSRFLQTLKEYQKAPEITRKRLYIEVMEEVLSKVSKVMVKVQNGNSLLYLPLDQFGKQRGNAAAVDSNNNGFNAADTMRNAPFENTGSPRGDSRRGREGR